MWSSRFRVGETLAHGVRPPIPASPGRLRPRQRLHHHAREAGGGRGRGIVTIEDINEIECNAPATSNGNRIVNTYALETLCEAARMWVRSEEGQAAIREGL